MASLRELQASFGAALRDPASAGAWEPTGNVSVYRNNVAITFRTALERQFPVVLRRVGDDYFRQLAHFYRERFPSRSGDVHEVGRDFPRFLAEHLHGDDYAWLADLATLERARDEAGVAADLPAMAADALARFAPEDLEHLTFSLQPSLRLVASQFPVFSVWRANQEENAASVDQSTGSEHVLVRIHGESIEVELVEPDLFLFLCALRSGATLGTAMTTAGAQEARLLHLLKFVFGAGLVCVVEGPQLRWAEGGDIVLM